MLLVSTEPADLMKEIASYQAPQVEKWVGVKTRGEEFTNNLA
jgi:hypothetical protein